MMTKKCPYNTKAVLPPAALWPHLWALWECLPAARSPSSCGCGCALCGWGSQRVPGQELDSWTSFTGGAGVGGRRAEHGGRPSRGPCLGPPGAAVLLIRSLIRSRARATQAGSNILKTPAEPGKLVGPGHKPPPAQHCGMPKSSAGRGR